MNQNYEINFPQARAQSQSWILAALVTFFCLVLAMALVRFVQPFATLFNGLGLDIPLPTHFLIANYSGLLPVYFGVVFFVLYLPIITIAAKLGDIN